MDIQQAYTETIDLLKAHGLYEQGWRFELGRGKRRLGACSHRYKKIRISRHHILHSRDDEILDTIRHEVAHALAGPQQGHGPEWKRWAVRLGANPRSRARLADSIPHRYELVCDNCGVVAQRRHNRINPGRLVRLRHRGCGDNGTLTLNVVRR